MLRKTPALASQGVSPPHTPLLDPVLANFEASACRQPTFQLASKHQTKDFTTPPPLQALQGSSRAPCLNKRCGIFLGNDEAISHKRKEKIPHCKKASWKTNRTVSLASAERKDLTSRLLILDKEACCAGTVETRGGKSLWPDAEHSSFQSWGPNLTLHVMLPTMPLGAPPSSLPPTCLKQQM